MNEEQEREYREHYSPDGERLEYLMEHPEENSEYLQANTAPSPSVNKG